jgi:4-hydroxythreonine-4-phosphate dehydrogenase
MVNVGSKNNCRLPVIGITIGNAAGIGPEIVLRSLADLLPAGEFSPILIGDLQHLTDLNDSLGTELKLTTFSGSEYDRSTIPVADLNNIPADLVIGSESEASGKASGQYIEKAVDLWRSGTIDVIATAPISKRSLALGGYDYPGHTEFLASLTNTERFAMSFFADRLRVVLVSTHVPLIDAIALVTPERLLELIEFTDDSLSKLLGRKVKIAVAGINPHASENGMFGTEEEERIEPGIRKALEKGIDVSGPYSPDTIFLRGYNGEFDAVVACYHDQATIAVKSLSFGSGVNVTLGLPLIRTSVDHGTAFDIAGKGIADQSSMKAAICLAAELYRGKQDVPAKDLRNTAS